MSFLHDLFSGTMEKLRKSVQARDAGGCPARKVVPEGAPFETDTVDLGGGVRLEMVWCPAGSFLMGSPESEAKRRLDETQHRVTLTKGYWLCMYAVTQRQWEAVMGSNPSSFKGADPPAEQVNWGDCQRFCQRLNGKLAARGEFRLPTEAEWEYACRAGTAGPYAGNLDEMGWYDKNSGGTTHPVGQKRPNAWGLFDMHGNVNEWCQDWYGNYTSGSVTDPVGAASGPLRVFRGGDGNAAAGDCRSASRDCYNEYFPFSKYYGFGFRAARTLP